MRPDIHGLRLRMTAEIQGDPLRVGLTAKQKRDRGGSGCIARQSFDDGAAQSRGAILVQQFHELKGLTTGRLALRERQVYQRFAFWRRLLQPAAGCSVECFAFYLQYRLLMNWIQY